jgi:uncharacterized protein YndB with AHSA1/START domain
MTDPLDSGPVGGASVAPDGDRWSLIFVRDLRHPPVAVWAALTDPARLDRWAPFIPARDLSTTGDTTLTMVDGPDRTEVPVTVRRAQPPVLLEYTWGGDLLRWELAGTDDGTRLTVLARLLAGDPVGVIRGRDAAAHGWEDLRAGYARALAS